MTKVLNEFLSATDVFAGAEILDPNGSVLLEVHRQGSENNDLAKIRDCVGAFLKSYPRAAIRRCFLEDETGIVAVSRIGRDRLLLLAAEPGVPLGAVSVAGGKLLAKLNHT